MCNFFSCLVDIDEKAYWKEGENSHDHLFEIFKLKDDKRQKVARVEVLPPSAVDGYIWSPLEKWRVMVDERVRPEWFTAAHEQAALNALKQHGIDFTKTFPGSLCLGFTSCGGYLDLGGYNHPLPEGLKKC